MTALLLAAACVATFCFIAWYMPKDYTSLLDDELTVSVDSLATELSHMPLEDSAAPLERFSSKNRIELSLLDQDGQVLFYYNDMPDAPAYDGFLIGIQQQGVAADEQVITEKDIVEDESRYSITAAEAAEATAGMVTTTIVEENSITSYEQSVFFEDGDGPYYLVITSRLYEVNRALESLSRVFPWLALVILVISLAGSLFYSLYITRPIVRISGISQKLAQLDFSWRCSEKRRDEIGVLAENLNELAERLDTALQALRQANEELSDDIRRERERERKRLEFFAAVSHELKTPITVIKGQLEGMIDNVGNYKDRDKYLARSLQVAQNLDNMVQEILTISRIESNGFTVRPEELDFTALVGETLDLYRDRAAEKGLHLNEELAANLCTEADPMLLRRVIDNLVANAIKYSPSGETVYVKARPVRHNIWFTILNTGAHIPEDSLPRIYEAFYRVEKSRSRESGGSGLGLYLTKMILDLHSASYRIENTAAGVQFSFELARAPENNP
jgi:two-component system sensor histidine kinase VanS